MKKRIAVIGCLLTLLALAGCGSGNGGETTAPETTAASNGIESSLALLTTVWESWPEESKFAVAGGDSEAYVMDAPGAFSVENPEALDGTLAFPASEAEQIDDAASLLHMMNANNFTAGAFRLKDAGNAETVAEAIRSNLDSRQWLCGFPEEYLIASVDNSLVCVFGTADNVSGFQEQLVSAYENVQVFSQGPVSAG